MQLLPSSHYLCDSQCFCARGCVLDHMADLDVHDIPSFTPRSPNGDPLFDSLCWPCSRVLRELQWACHV